MYEVVIEGVTVKAASAEAVLALVRVMLVPITVALPPVATPPPSLPVLRQPWNESRDCKRCGKAFTPTQGSAGNYCSRECYAGMPPTERRQRIVAALEGGALLPNALMKVPELASISKATIYNDLATMTAKGVIHNTDNGWALRRGDFETRPLVHRDEPSHSASTSAN